MYTKASKIIKPIKIISISDLYWFEGLEYAIDAMGIVKKFNRPFSYTIFGNGPDYERLIFAAHQNNVSENFQIVKKFNLESVLMEVTRDNIYLRPSLKGSSILPSIREKAGFCIISENNEEKESSIERMIKVEKRSPKALAEVIIKFSEKRQ